VSVLSSRPNLAGLSGGSNSPRRPPSDAHLPREGRLPRPARRPPGTCSLDLADPNVVTVAVASPSGGRLVALFHTAPGRAPSSTGPRRRSSRGGILPSPATCPGRSAQRVPLLRTAPRGGARLALLGLFLPPASPQPAGGLTETPDFFIISTSKFTKFPPACRKSSPHASCRALSCLSLAAPAYALDYMTDVSKAGAGVTLARRPRAVTHYLSRRHVPRRLPRGTPPASRRHPPRPPSRRAPTCRSGARHAPRRGRRSTSAAPTST
jgi:hypothetical protein